jgi:acyl carrier protein
LPQKNASECQLKNSEIVSQLEQHIAAKVLRQPARRIVAGEALITSGLLSSLQLVDIALYVEDAFGVRIEDTELTSSFFDTLEQLAGIIVTRRSAP